MSDVIRVRVIVLEDEQEVANMDIGYYRGQDYNVDVVTPDGRDRTFVKIAGETEREE